MTNLEAVIAVVTVPVSSYPGISVEKALLDQGLNPVAEYTSEVAKKVDFAAIRIIRGLLGLSKIAEGNFEIGFSTEGLKAILSGLETEHELNTTGPTIRARQIW